MNPDLSAFNAFYHYRHLFFQILKPSEKKAKYQYGGVNSGRPVTPPRTTQAPKKRWAAGPDSPAPPPAGLWPTSLQAASNTPALSQSACSCVNRNSRSVFCLFCGYFYEHVSGNFSIIFFLMPLYVLTQPSLLLLSPFSNIKTNLLWNGQDVKKRCFSAFRLTISIVILWLHACLWDWDGFFALADVKSINSPRQQSLISP